MKKSELIKALAEKLGVTQVEAEKTLGAVSDVFRTALKDGKEVPLSFGKFKPTSTPARDVKLPGGAVKAVPASRGARFSLVKAGKEYLNS